MTGDALVTHALYDKGQYDVLVGLHAILNSAS